MRVAIGNNDDLLGFTVTPRKSRRHPAKVITDLDFADDIALLSDTLLQAQNLLYRVERAADSVELQMNDSKTKFMAYNIKDGLQHHSVSSIIFAHVVLFLYFVLSTQVNLLC